MRQPSEIKIGERTLAEALEKHEMWALMPSFAGVAAMLSLYNADLRNVDLSGAFMNFATLCGCDLSGADLSGASMVGADLSFTNLEGANLTNTLLEGACLIGAKNIPYIPMVCPVSGAFTGWKQCRGHRIVQLEVPADAKRSSGVGRKCRCDKAKVVSIRSIDGWTSYDEAVSIRDANFRYEVGKMVSVQNFCEDRYRECAPGIHFFINRQEAVDYDRVVRRI